MDFLYRILTSAYSNIYFLNILANKNLSPSFIFKAVNFYAKKNLLSEVNMFMKHKNVNTKLLIKFLTHENRFVKGAAIKSPKMNIALYSFMLKDKDPLFRKYAEEQLINFL